MACSWRRWCSRSCRFRVRSRFDLTAVVGRTLERQRLSFASVCCIPCARCGGDCDCAWPADPRALHCRDSEPALRIPAPARSIASTHRHHRLGPLPRFFSRSHRCAVPLATIQSTGCIAISGMSASLVFSTRVWSPPLGFLLTPDVAAAGWPSPTNGVPDRAAHGGGAVVPPPPCPGASGTYHSLSPSASMLTRRVAVAVVLGVAGRARPVLVVALQALSVCSPHMLSTASTTRTPRLPSTDALPSPDLRLHL